MVRFDADIFGDSDFPRAEAGVIVDAFPGMGKNRKDVGVIDILRNPKSQLFQIAGAGSLFGTLFCRIQRRQQHSRQNRNDRDHDQELYQGEKSHPSAEISDPSFHTSSTFEISTQ